MRRVRSTTLCPEHTTLRSALAGLLLAPRVDRLHPGGISLEQYQTFSAAIGAEPILVPNLETATVADQAAWFADLFAQGAVPSHIELGNEFYLAMENDPHVLQRWPDEPTSMAIMQQYASAFRPYLPAEAKVAVQAAPDSFGVGPGDQGPFWDRLRQWNDDLAPEPWFDAVTVHLYSRLEEVTGDPNANHEPVTEATAQRNFAALMARHDEGTDRALADLEARVPGKEIWVTEWNPRGGQVWVPGQTEAVTPAMALQLVTRMELACLWHASVTVNLFFMVDFLVNTPLQAFVSDGSGGYFPLPATAVLGWFCDAANGGSTFQRLVEPSAPRLPGGGSQPETYAAVEGAVFRLSS